MERIGRVLVWLEHDEFALTFLKPVIKVFETRRELCFASH